MTKHYFISARTQFDNLGDALINDVLFSIARFKGTLHFKPVECDTFKIPFAKYIKIIVKSICLNLQRLFMKFLIILFILILLGGFIYIINKNQKDNDDDDDNDDDKTKMYW